MKGNFLFAKRRRLSLVLSARDRDGSGLILAPQFTNALRMLGSAPTDRNMALLVEFCGDPKTDSFVNWREITSAVDTGTDTASGQPPKFAAAAPAAASGDEGHFGILQR
jgi:hypothetical protein